MPSRPWASYLIGDIRKAAARPTPARNLASEHAQVIRNVAVPDDRRVTEVAGRSIAHPAVGRAAAHDIDS
jgi:hypothetical protein